MSISQEHIDAVRLAAIEYKELLVSRFGTGTDIRPQLDVQFANDRRFIGQPTEHLFELTEVGVPMFELIGAAIRLLWNEHDRPIIRCVQMIAEGYERFNPDIENYQHGDMERDFATRADSDVVEVIIIHIATCEQGNLRLTMVTQPYSYTDGGKVAWGEHLVVHNHDAEGNIVDMFRTLFADTGGLHE